MFVEGKPVVACTECAADVVSTISNPTKLGFFYLHRPVHEIQIHIIGTKILQRLIQRLLHLFRSMACIP